VLKRSHFLFLLIGLVLVGASCQRKNINTNDAVRTAVVAHIESRGDLALTDLDITLRNVRFDGDRCQAEVLFAPKGQPAESGMTMSYDLERDGDGWKVKPKAPGAHAAPQGEVPGSSTAPLPAGHPPVAPGGSPAQP
jgi:hypothetical protein